MTKLDGLVSQTPSGSGDSNSMSGFPFVDLGQDLTFLPPYYTVDANGQPVLQDGLFLQNNVPEFQNNLHAGVFIDYEDQNRTLSPSLSGSRIRKRTGPGGEPQKFRRTRSGCYTCRNRRVKVRAFSFACLHLNLTLAV
jgi:hypothetical protein